ncbi:MAG: hypothetical protein R3A47_06020 [Polyangiales bacterium]
MKDEQRTRPLMPSHVREKVLAQHREIESVLSELGDGVRASL